MTKEQRAKIAREYRDTSKGPVTPEGKEKSARNGNTRCLQTEKLKHFILLRSFRRPGVSLSRNPDTLRTANFMTTDIGIQQDIEKELSWDPGVTAEHIAVTVKNGAVVLIGDVGSYWEKCAAERAAWRVAHVKTVANNLRVDLPFPSERNDDDIALAAMSMLEWNCIVPATIEVQVTASWIILSGAASWHYQKEEAERALAALTGIKGIKNEIQLHPAPHAADVRVAIDEAIKRSALVDSSHVKAHAAHGVVSLRGAVRTRAEQAEAMHAAWAAPGVTHVEDHISIG